jgi:hypothetical protein
LAHKSSHVLKWSRQRAPLKRRWSSSYILYTKIYEIGIYKQKRKKKEEIIKMNKERANKKKNIKMKEKREEKEKEE